MAKKGVREPWDKMDGEPAMWFSRFDMYYRPMVERTLGAAYRAWLKDTRGPDAVVRQTPQSWVKAAEQYRWEERADAFDEIERKKRHAAEEKAREESRAKRIAILNAVTNKSFAALQQLDVSDAKWGDVVNAVRMVVQELRQEYDGQDKQAGVQNINTGPTWALHLQGLAPGDVDRLISNLLPVQQEQAALPPAPIRVLEEERVA